QLLAEGQRLRREGQPSAPYYVELHKRFALPVAALVFTLVGFPLGIRSPPGPRSHRAGRAPPLALSFGIVVGYYILYNSMEGFALRGRIPAGIAVWIPNAILAVVGVVLLRASAVGAPTAAFDLFWRLWARVEQLRPSRVVRPVEERKLRRLGRFAGPRESTFIIDRYLIRQYLLFLGIGNMVRTVLIAGAR